MAEKALRYALPKLVNNTTSNILDKVYTHSIQGYTFYVKQNLICKYSDIVLLMYVIFVIDNFIVFLI